MYTFGECRQTRESDVSLDSRSVGPLKGPEANGSGMMAAAMVSHKASQELIGEFSFVTGKLAQ